MSRFLFRRGRKGPISALIALVVALVVGPVVTGVTVSSASAATCSGYGCDNRDPIATGCDSGARTVASDPLRYDANGSIVGWLDLRYSDACGTNWARVRSLIGVQELNMGIRRRNESGLTTSGNYITGWSNMVYAPTPVVACASGGIYNRSINRFASDYVRPEICY